MLNYQHETPTAPAYDDNFVLWLDAQVEFLRAGRYELLDKDNLLEELTAMNRPRTPQYLQQAGSSHHSSAEMPISGRPENAQLALEPVYSRARREAVRQTGLPAAAFPDACPYSFEQLLDDDFLP
jgi:hypothetical protein